MEIAAKGCSQPTASPREGVARISTLTSLASLPLQSPATVALGAKPNTSQRHEIYRSQHPRARWRRVESDLEKHVEDSQELAFRRVFI